jgi:hypothetical protein
MEARGEFMKRILAIGMLFAFAHVGHALADSTIDIVHICKSVNIDAALKSESVATKVPNQAARDGEICIAYVNAVVDGYAIGSTAAENYITGFLANQLAHMQSDTSNSSTVDEMKGALMSSTKDNLYTPCLPAKPARDVYPRVVAAYIEDRKISSYPTPALLVTDAMQEKYPAGSCGAASK